MNNKIYIPLIAFMVFFVSGCNMSMSVVSDDPKLTPDDYKIYSADAYGTFYNWDNKGIKKTYRDPTKAGMATGVGADYIGKNNYSVTYRITYWESLLSVFSLGFYVPLTIEYVPLKQPKDYSDTKFASPEK